jgi:hypothetical protein
LALHSVIRLSAVVPKHQNPNACFGFPEEQTVRERREIGASEHVGNQVETARIPFDPARQRLELQVKPFRKLRADFFGIVSQNASKVPLNEAMER